MMTTSDSSNREAATEAGWQWGFNFSTNIQKELDDIDRRLGGSIWTAYIRKYIEVHDAELAQLRERLATVEAENAALVEFVKKLANYKPESNQSEYYDGIDTARDQIADDAKDVLLQAAAALRPANEKAG